MPELPELEVIRQRLRQHFVHKVIRDFKILKPYVLKNYFRGDLSGEEGEDIDRRGKYLIFQMTSHNVYVHLKLRGSVDHVMPSEKIGKSVNAVFVLDEGTRIEFRETGTNKRMSIYVRNRRESPEFIQKLGIEPFSGELTVEELGRLLRRERKQLKSFLCHQSTIAGIGNAYSDEILWKARLAPFRLSFNLNALEVLNLHSAILDVLHWGIKEASCSKRLDKRDFLMIHGKRNSPCPRCGDSIRTVSFSNRDMFYCPNCQTGGKILRDRRMSKFYR